MNVYGQFKADQRSEMFSKYQDFFRLSRRQSGECHYINLGRARVRGRKLPVNVTFGNSCFRCKLNIFLISSNEHKNDLRESNHQAGERICHILPSNQRDIFFIMIAIKLRSTHVSWE